MGDRGHITIEQHGDNDPVVLYTHWHARNLPAIVAEALSHQQRWGDPEYLARIIFDHISAKASEFTGAGIGTAVHGDAWRVIEIDPQSQVGEDIHFAEGHGYGDDTHGGETYCFEGFIREFGTTESIKRLESDSDAVEAE